ncbi:MAG: 2-C-methyl-D-erythritol 4-phosphate cytidylyltransferase [Nitrospirae bacterium]|nr:2-C-methyl-D-erythritol 4-phosphate cytidylyltransferase [Nitrospirota bacterium]
MNKKKPHRASPLTHRIVAIVPAAGIGRRFGTSKKKPFVNLSGFPLLIHTLKRLHSVKAITEIVPVLGKEDIEKGFKLIKTYKLTKIKRIAAGGKERQDSVYNALCLIRDKTQKAGNDLVLIHDGVRPLVTAELVKRLLSEFDVKHKGKGIDGVIPGTPMKETLKEIDKNSFVLSTKNREMFRAIQTPQVFRLNALKKAYTSACRDGFYATDDAALVERIGGRIRVIPGHLYNIKVTTPEDAEIVEFLLSKAAFQI